ncbi:MAG: hypothetical protein Q8874_02820, partial [Sweet potato little leaf phytoplasma]|nr:hypothetical protein [Sweet potato little leaf phytoplasma]
AESMKDTDHANTESQVPLEIWSLAKALIKSVFQKTGLLHDQNFCNAFGKIACVPAEKFYIPEIRGKKDKRVVCSYSDAILLKDWPLAWTSAPILTIESMVPPDYSWGALQLRSPPPITAVLKHLQVCVCVCVYMFLRINVYMY